MVLLISFCVFELWADYFLSVCCTSFRISCKAGLLSMNYFSFCFFRIVFILPLFLMNSFTGYRILCYRFFFLQHLDYVVSCFLASIVFLFVLLRFSLSLAFNNDMSGCGSLCVYPTLDSLNFNL